MPLIDRLPVASMPVMLLPRQIMNVISMLDSKPLLFPSSFPAPRRKTLRILQVNLGYRCNQQCQHCHVNAGPKRTEAMTRQTVDDVLACLREQRIGVLDLTGGAPELNAHFRYLVEQASELGCEVIDRCNLTILEEPGQRDLAGFLAARRVRVVASMPVICRRTSTGSVALASMRQVFARCNA